MNDTLRCALSQCETDLAGTMRRFSGNEALYLSCLAAFLEDNTLEELKRAIDGQAWDNAFTAAHALKGLAGNMGFVPLFHATSELVVVLRSGRLKELEQSCGEVCRCYDSITNAIRQTGGRAAEAQGGAEL